MKLVVLYFNSFTGIRFHKMDLVKARLGQWQCLSTDSSIHSIHNFSIAQKNSWQWKKSKQDVKFMYTMVGVGEKFHYKLGWCDPLQPPKCPERSSKWGKVESSNLCMEMLIVEKYCSQTPNVHCMRPRKVLWKLQERLNDQINEFLHGWLDIRCTYFPVQC